MLLKFKKAKLVGNHVYGVGEVVELADDIANRLIKSKAAVVTTDPVTPMPEPDPDPVPAPSELGIVTNDVESKTHELKSAIDEAIASAKNKKKG